MIKKFLLLSIGAILLSLTGCNEGIDDWNSSAKISGWVYADDTHTSGVEGVQVIIESDAQSENPYEGPDRWTVSAANGRFEGAVFLGNHFAEGQHYVYVGDLSVAYFYHGRTFRWSGGITVSPGTDFTLPAVDLSMFQ